MKTSPLLVVAFLGSAILSPFAQLRLIDAEDASFLTGHDLLDSGVIYDYVLDGDPYSPWLSSGTNWGTRSLAFRVAGNSGGSAWTHDRAEYKLIKHNEGGALKFDGQGKYTGFRFRIDSANSAPQLASAIFYQCWQGWPFNPPLAFKIRPPNSGSSLHKIQIGVRDSIESGAPEEIIYNGELEAGRWYAIVIFVRLSNAPAGEPNKGAEVKLWIDGTRVLAWGGTTSTKRLGYPVSGGVTYTGCDVKFGIYQVLPNAKLHVYFDNVKFDSTYANSQP